MQDELAVTGTYLKREGSGQGKWDKKQHSKYNKINKASQKSRHTQGGSLETELSELYCFQFSTK